MVTKAAPQTKPARASEAQAAFLKALGHDHDNGHDDIRRLDHAVDAALCEVIQDRARAAESTYGTCPSCGWWFCLADESTVQWGELEKARVRLEKAGIEPHGQQVSQLAYGFSNTLEWGEERADLAAFKLELERISKDPGLPHGNDSALGMIRARFWGALESLKAEYLSELEQREEHAEAARNVRNGHREKQEPIKLGISWGWTVSQISAALVLTGGEKLYKADTLRTVDERIRRIAERL